MNAETNAGAEMNAETNAGAYADVDAGGPPAEKVVREI